MVLPEVERWLQIQVTNFIRRDFFQVVSGVSFFCTSFHHAEAFLAVHNLRRLCEEMCVSSSLGFLWKCEKLRGLQMTRQKTEPQEIRHSKFSILSPNWHITEHVQESHTSLHVISKSSGMRAVRTITRTTTTTTKNICARNGLGKCPTISSWTPLIKCCFHMLQQVLNVMGYKSSLEELDPQSRQWSDKRDLSPRQKCNLRKCFGLNHP